MGYKYKRGLVKTTTCTYNISFDLFNNWCSVQQHIFLIQIINRPHRDKTCLWGFRQSGTQTNLISYRDWLEIEISHIACLDMIPFKKQIKRVLIRLHGCTGWSVPVLFANLRRHVFSRRGPNINYRFWN